MRRIIKKSISVLMSFTVFAAALPAMAEKSGTAELISVTTESIKLDTKNKITFLQKNLIFFIKKISRTNFS